MYNKPALSSKPGSTVDQLHEGGQVSPSEPSFSTCKLEAVTTPAHMITEMK